jgi:exo-1,4-beta-D-glucosaminidase
MRKSIGMVLFAAFAANVAQVSASQARIDLQKGWSIQSSAKVSEKGDAISTSRFQAREWYPAGVPATVLTALINNKVYPGDPYFGMNLRLIPGTTYPIAQNFANLPMPQDSPFAVSWWYRTDFQLPANLKGKTLWLNFDGINNRANIWLNGRQIADAARVNGMYRMWEFDVTEVAVPGGGNTLAVEVFPPTPTDLSITYVDWNPLPADKDMGLVRDVYILATGPAALRNVQVTAKVPSPEQARLTLSADVRNAGAQPVDGTLNGTIGGIAVSKKVHVDAKATARVEFTPNDTPQLKVANPKLWWPYPLGPQNLEAVHVEFLAGNEISDKQDFQVGIREVTSEVDAQTHRVFKINGHNILIRGGGWSSDMFLRYDPERTEQELFYTRDMHLNTVRLEGKMMTDHFFETTDRLGLLVMPGWCCCAFWERWRNWKPEDYNIAGESLRDQVRRLRNHASVFTFLYGSDNSPTAEAEAVYLKVLKEENWPNPYVSSAAKRTTEATGPTGVKMTGPYDYVAPSYWLEDKERGGAHGFNTETSPGPAIPELASLAQMLPKEHLWPIDDFWNFHAGGGGYRNVNVFTAALEGRYGKAKGLEDYVRKSQMMTYEGERAMFEAFGRNKYNATGVVQWMLNNAWPSIIWHLYDYYLRPGGGYFGTKKANELVHVQYSYDDRSVAVVNSYYRAFPGYKVTAKVYNLDMTEKFSKTAAVEIASDSAARVFEIPEIAGLSSAYFVKLNLEDSAGKPVSSNFYWLSTQPDVNDFAHSNGRLTPITKYADFTALEKLPQVQLKVNARTETRGADQVERVTLENPGKDLAFFVHLRVVKGENGEEIAPIIWDDNYFELMPGEKREVTATYKRQLMANTKAAVKVDGWNVSPVTK